MEILIIEDEQNAIERLENLVTEIAPGKKIAGRCRSVEQTIQWLNEHPYPDLILSDVQLSDGLSFDIFRQLKIKVPIIFISAFDNYALDAFKAEGLHYLLKPVKKDELKEAIGRYDTNHGSKSNSTEKQKLQPVAGTYTKPYQERFIINAGAQIKLVHDCEIAYFFTENKVVYMVTFGQQKFVMDITLENFEKALNPKLFYRINRQFIVNLNAITKMTPASKQRIALTLTPSSSFETITSFERTPQFKKWLLGDI